MLENFRRLRTKILVDLITKGAKSLQRKDLVGARVLHASVTRKHKRKRSNCFSRLCSLYGLKEPNGCYQDRTRSWSRPDSPSHRRRRSFIRRILPAATAPPLSPQLAACPQTPPFPPTPSNSRRRLLLLLRCCARSLSSRLLLLCVNVTVISRRRIQCDFL